MLFIFLVVQNRPSVTYHILGECKYVEKVELGVVNEEAEECGEYAR